MKYWFYLLMLVIGSVLGCVSAPENVSNYVVDNRVTEKSQDVYIIDSKPQGLRVVVDDFERGITPCKLNRKDYQYSSSIWVKVMPPTDKHLYDYGVKNKKIVSIYYTESQNKRIDTRIPGGRMLFDFIDKEYDVPTTEEEREWVLERIEEDTEKLEKERKQRELWLQNALKED